jgi:hypothetical protein
MSCRPTAGRELRPVKVYGIKINRSAEPRKAWPQQVAEDIHEQLGAAALRLQG